MVNRTAYTKEKQKKLNIHSDALDKWAEKEVQRRYYERLAKKVSTR